MDSLPEKVDLSLVTTADLIEELMERHSRQKLAAIFCAQIEDAVDGDGDLTRWTGMRSQVYGLMFCLREVLQAHTNKSVINPPEDESE